MSVRESACSGAYGTSPQIAVRAWSGAAAARGHSRGRRRVPEHGARHSSSAPAMSATGLPIVDAVDHVRRDPRCRSPIGRSFLTDAALDPDALRGRLGGHRVRDRRAERDAVRSGRFVEPQSLRGGGGLVGSGARQSIRARRAGDRVDRPRIKPAGLDRQSSIATPQLHRWRTKADRPVFADPSAIVPRDRRASRAGAGRLSTALRNTSGCSDPISRIRLASARGRISSRSRRASRLEMGCHLHAARRARAVSTGSRAPRAIRSTVVVGHAAASVGEHTVDLAVDATFPSSTSST